jgi:hypothetical protein
MDGPQGFRRLVKMPAAVTQHSLIGPGSDHLDEEGTVGLLGVGLRQHPAFLPRTLPSTSGMPRNGLSVNPMPYRANLPPDAPTASSMPLTEPTVQVRSVWARQGTFKARHPEASINSRFHVLLSMTTAMRGDVNSTGIDQAAAIMLRRPTWAPGGWHGGGRRIAWASL